MSAGESEGKRAGEINEKNKMKEKEGEKFVGKKSNWIGLEVDGTSRPTKINSRTENERLSDIQTDRE